MMRIWVSYLSNHSTHFTTTGTFDTSQHAVNVANWIKKVLSAFGIETFGVETDGDFEVKTKDNTVIIKYYGTNPNTELEDFLSDEGAEVKTKIQ